MHLKNITNHKPQNWNFNYALSPLEAIFAELKTSQKGLPEAEGVKRVMEFGKNELAKKKKRILIHEIASRFTNPLIILLLFIGTFSLFFGEKFSAIIVYAMAFMSALLSFYQEHKAEKAVEDLNALVRTTVAVLRDGRLKEKNMKDLVPGDVINLSAGDVVPADIRLISCKDLFVSQSALTGESMPVEKFSQCDINKTGNFIELCNMAFMGSSVVSGTGEGVVIHTGVYTEFGKISKELLGVNVETSFDKGIKDFTWMMIKAILAMVIIILAINVITKHSFFESVLFALAVAVGLAPETLPMLVTINLSKGALLMSKKKVVVKRLDAIQNFGAMDILCTDKTGTLTMDQVVLEKYCDVSQKDSSEVLELGFLNSFYQTGLKSLLDQAVLKHEHNHLLNYKKVDEIPFDFTRRIMSVVVESPGKNLMMAVKGAPEEIFKRCSRFQKDGTEEVFDDCAYKSASQAYHALSQQGFRVLAVAYKKFAAEKKVFEPADENDLVLKGFLAFLDPPKPTAKQALESLEKVGIKIKVLTGDNELVTEKICKDIGLNVEGMLTGEKVEQMSDEELKKLVEKVTVFSRMLPLQKERVIRMLHGNGHVVGFLGDGINDSPALKAADVSISVNNAVDIARESANIILLKKSLVVLYDGVLEGRKVFGNILKYVRMGSSSNFGNMFSMTGASLFLPFLPMLPIQILLNNFLYDLSQLALPTDNVDEGYLQSPKPWNIGLVKKFMVLIGPISSLFDFLTFGVMWWVFLGFNNQALFHTGWFLESLLSQTLVIYVIRTRKIPFLESRPGKYLVINTFLVLTAAFVVPYTPLAKVFGLVAPPPFYYAILAAMMVCYLLMVQFAKEWFIKKYGYE